MENFLLALNTVLPIFIMMMIGVFLKKKKIVDDYSLNVMNKLVFRVFMSILLFLNIYNIGNLDVYTKDSIRFLFFPIGAVLVTSLLAWLYYSRRVMDRKKLAVLIQGSYRGNFILFGLTITESLYGDVGLAKVSTLPVIIIPLFNIFAVLTLEYYCGSEISWKKIVKSTLKNPLIIATILALIALKFKITFPNSIYKTLVSLGRVTTPLAFVVLGGSLQIGNILKNIRYLLSVNFIKLVINPSIMMVAGYYLFHFSKVELVSLLSASACPTAIASFTMAKEMNADGDLAGEIVASTSLVSILSIFLWIVILKRLSWI